MLAVHLADASSARFSQRMNAHQEMQKQAMEKETLATTMEAERQVLA